MSKVRKSSRGQEYGPHLLASLHAKKQQVSKTEVVLFFFKQKLKIDINIRISAGTTQNLQESFGKQHSYSVILDKQTDL